MTASASRSAPDATALARFRTRAAAGGAVVALLAALGQATMQPATAAVPAGEGPYTIFGDTAPAIGAWPDDEAVELGVKFRTDVDGWITGVRFYKGRGNGGTHTGSLWTASGELLASGTFSAETDEGWQHLAFDEAVPVHSGRTYVASYLAPGGHYATNLHYFTGSAAGEGPVHALASGVDGPNGVFRYGSQPSFPVDTFRDQNYWVDVVFLAAVPADDDPAAPADPAVPVDPTDPVVSPVPHPEPGPVPSDPLPPDPEPSSVRSDPEPSPVRSDPEPSPGQAAPPEPTLSPELTEPEPSPVPRDPVSRPTPTDPVPSPGSTAPTDPAPADSAGQAVPADPTPAMTAPATGLDETGTTADADARAQLAQDGDGTSAAVRVALLTAPALAAAAGLGTWRVRRVRGRRL